MTIEKYHHDRSISSYISDDKTLLKYAELHDHLRPDIKTHHLPKGRYLGPYPLPGKGDRENHKQADMLEESRSSDADFCLSNRELSALSITMSEIKLFFL